MKIKAEGLDKVVLKLNKLGGAVKDLRPAFDDMKGVIIQEFKANFPEAGGNLDMPWAPRRREYHWPILQKSGTLKKTWEDKTQKKELRITNPVEYASYHHFGTPRLPARRLVGASRKIIEIITTRALKYLKTFF